jgi:hypothetical protein
VNLYLGIGQADVVVTGQERPRCDPGRCTCWLHARAVQHY